MLFLASLSDYSLNKEILFILNISSLLLDLLPTPLLIWDGFQKRKTVVFENMLYIHLNFMNALFIYYLFCETLSLQTPKKYIFNNIAVQIQRLCIFVQNFRACIRNVHALFVAKFWKIIKFFIIMSYHNYLLIFNLFLEVCFRVLKHQFKRVKYWVKIEYTSIENVTKMYL